jgi:hypothetical protein
MNGASPLGSLPGSLCLVFWEKTSLAITMDNDVDDNPLK